MKPFRYYRLTLRTVTRELWYIYMPAVILTVVGIACYLSICFTIVALSH